MIRVLVVDDEPQVCRLLRQILERNGYACTTASDASEARALLKERSFELVLSDIHMPGESGLDLIRHVLSAHPDTAAVMVTAVDDPVVAETALEIGAYDYIIKPFEKNSVLISVANALRRRKLEADNRLYREKLEEMVSERTAELEQTLGKLRKTLEGTIRAIALTVEIRDPYTSGHQKRVADLSCAIARKMGLGEDRVEGLLMGGSVHDLGKIAVPAEILSKPTRLTPDEINLIRQHPKAGHDILKPLEFPWPIARMVLEHHERLDGSGYPRGLSGNEILLEARILAVSDVVEAMSSHRPYRPALGLDRALGEIEEKKGILYDPDAVDACTELLRTKGFNLKLFSDLGLRHEK